MLRSTPFAWANTRRAFLGSILLATAATTIGAQATPKTGAEVFQRMHDAYAGKWYRSLTFVQKTTQRRPNGTDTVTTWYERLCQVGPMTQLRIDTGDPSLGNGVLYTADSLWQMREGKLARTVAGGNEFLPLIEGVYFNPVQQTIAELSSTKVDMSRVTEGRYDNRRVWIIGATSAADGAEPTTLRNRSTRPPSMSTQVNKGVVTQSWQSLSSV